MKRLFYYPITVFLFYVILLSCKSELEQVSLQSAKSPVLSISKPSLVLNESSATDTVQTISWTPTDYGFKAAVTYTVQIAKSGTNFQNPRTISTGSSTFLKYTGASLNELAISQAITPGNSGSLEVRIKSALSDSVYLFSEKSSLTVTPYRVSFPALLVQGGNSWKTPSTKTNGYILSSVNYDGKYEGYLNLPNADGYGGDAFKLLSGTDSKVYGWGGTSTTMAINGGNLYLSPAPNYMKVNADINALTINFTPVKFFISGDNNGYSTSATPMTFNPTNNTWEATNVSFTAGNNFVFTSNGNYNISYKVDANNKIVYAGPPNWGGNNIVATKTGTFKVILDLSGGDGSYTYKIE